METLEKLFQEGKVVVLLDNGLTFEGDISHWKDSFYDNPTIANMTDWAFENNMNISFCPPK